MRPVCMRALTPALFRSAAFGQAPHIEAENQNYEDGIPGRSGRTILPGRTSSIQPLSNRQIAFQVYVLALRSYPYRNCRIQHYACLGQEEDFSHDALLFGVSGLSPH